MGAGFATGQELLQFFVYFGSEGLWGVMLAASLLGVFAYSVLDISRRLAATSYRDVVRHAAGDAVGSGVDYLIAFFLFGGLVSMVAGCGAVMGEQFGWDQFTGAAIMAVLAAATVLLGLQGIVDSMTFLVPFMFVGIVAMGFASALATGYFFKPLLWMNPASAPVPFWPLSAIVYASYNLVLTLAVLAPMGANTASSEHAAMGAAMGGAALGAAAIGGYFAITSRLPEVVAYEVPMMFVARAFGPLVSTAYAVVIIVSIYTTAISVLYGFASRLSPDTGPVRIAFILATSTAALMLASLGFANVVRVLYPSVGVAGMILLASLAFAMFRR